jgi:hypothetical protein
VLHALIAMAEAAEVVWLEPPSDDERLRVAQAASAEGPALEPVDFLAAATRWTPADDLALANLGTAVEQARVYESQLDGEILILRDLTGPIAAVTALRDENGRGRLFSALAYQGFAANRLYGDTLATAPEATPYRVELDGVVWEKPWVDAVALEPDREATPYDIAEAPQRVAFTKLRSAVSALLPATLTPTDLPADVTVTVDGRLAPAGASGNLKVRPGRHLVHLERQGRIVARWDVRVGPGDDVPISVPMSDLAWDTFVSSLAEGQPVPESVKPLVRALGGEVVFAEPGSAGPVAFHVTETEIRVLPIAPPAAAAAPPEEQPDKADLLVSVGALGGWFSSGDFYLQAPDDTPRTKDAVNAAAAGLWLSADVKITLVTLGAGVDLLVPFGEDHVALTGDDTTRVRPIPHVAAGIRYVQATAGFLFPYHPAVGGRVRVPLGPLEVRLVGWAGLPGEPERDDGTTYDRQPVYTVDAGLGAAF